MFILTPLIVNLLHIVHVNVLSYIFKKYRVLVLSLQIPLTNVRVLHVYTEIVPTNTFIMSVLVNQVTLESIVNQVSGSLI